MSNPVPGSTYTVVSGDTLSGISARAYGDGTQWGRIFDANQSNLKSDNPDIIFPGEVLIIPVIPELDALKDTDRFKNKEPDEFTLVIDGAEIPVSSSQIVRTMDTAADGWTARIAWTPGADPKLDERLAPYSYKKASVYLGNTLMVNGLVYTISPELTSRGSIQNVEGYSFTADIVDSKLKPPYEQNKVTLQQRAEKIVTPLGINVVFDFQDDGVFDRVTADVDATIFRHLAPLAAQRGALVSSTRKGELLFTKANTGTKPVGTLEEGQVPVTEWAATYDGRKRFNTYRVIGQTPGSNAQPAISKDDFVPRSRFMTLSANELTAGEKQIAADWRRSKQLARALSISLPVSTWYAPNGQLWEENTLITVVSPTLFVPNGFTFLIRRVTYNFDNQGTYATLDLTIPQVYTGEPIVEPWRIQT